MLALENSQLLAQCRVFDDEICAIHHCSTDEVDDGSEDHSNHGIENPIYGYSSQYDVIVSPPLSGAQCFRLGRSIVERQGIDVTTDHDRLIWTSKQPLEQILLPSVQVIIPALDSSKQLEQVQHDAGKQGEEGVMQLEPVQVLPKKMDDKAKMSQE